MQTLGLKPVAEIIINAPANKVWQAIVKPELVKQYLFGTNMEADFRVGGQITYGGEWEAKSYKDKGEILEIEPEKFLVSTYWSAMSGKADLPENYETLAYGLTPQENSTKVTVYQKQAPSDTSEPKTENNWKMVLDKMKEVVEK